MAPKGNTTAAHQAPPPSTRMWLGLILLGGAGLRLFRLGADSLWYDETVSTYLAGSPISELLRHTAGDIHPPGYYLLLRAWLLLTGYPTGHADAHGNGLEFAAAFFSLSFGVLLIALVYAFAKRLVGARVALLAAGLVALSPFNVWYSQEVRMYTLGAVLGLGALWALVEIQAAAVGQRVRGGAYVIYACCAAAGMYVLYYFAFLLVPLNLWAFWELLRRRQRGRGLLAANLVAAALYAPWLGVAFRQATEPPVPPWRTPPDLLRAVIESWTALSFGQSAPGWVWPALLVTFGLFVLGIVALRGRAIAFLVAALGPVTLILTLSLVTPLYHVRYVFTYSPAFYIIAAAGLVQLARWVRGAGVAAVLILVLVSVVSLRSYWYDPAFRADDHRSAVRALQARWQPGDVVMVNAGWAYTALTTYWPGKIGGRYRLTGALPEPRGDAALVMVTTGHTDGRPQLGWGDLRSDFFAMPAEIAKAQTADLFSRFTRIWQYRIYDTVNDPDGLMRALLPRYGQLIDARTYPGEAYLRVEAYTPRSGGAWDEGAPGAAFDNVALRFTPPPTVGKPGDTLTVALMWRPATALALRLATSLRLVGPDGENWAQPADEQPLGPLFLSTQWPAGGVQRQPLGLTISPGTAPGQYELVLVVYDASNGQPLAFTPVNGAIRSAPGLELGRVQVGRADPAPNMLPALAQFGPLDLLATSTPVTAVAPGALVPVELLWQARAAPGQVLVVVVQALDESGQVVAGLEAEPLGGRYPTALWSAGELVRDRHTLSLPATLLPGRYRLIVGLYDASTRERFSTRTGLLTNDVSWTIKEIEVR